MRTSSACALMVVAACAACTLSSEGTSSTVSGSGGAGASSASTSVSSSSAGDGGGGAGPGSGGSAIGGGGLGGAGASAGSGAGGTAPSCEGAGEFFGGPMSHCYLFVQAPPEDLTWDQARQACVDWQPQGDLAALSSQEEYDYVLGQVGGANDDSWIGGFDPGMGGEIENFVWSNGEAWGDDGWVTGDAPWKGGEPQASDDRLKIHDGFEGKAFTDTSPKGYVCERP